VDGVDAVRDDQRGALLPFGQEITHRPIQRASHTDGLSVARQQGEGPVDLADGFRFAGEDALARLVHAKVVEVVQRRFQKINDTFDVVVHKLELVICAHHRGWENVWQSTRTPPTEPRYSPDRRAPGIQDSRWLSNSRSESSSRRKSALNKPFSQENLSRLTLKTRSEET